MDKKEALKILTDDNQNIIDSFYPFQVNKKWKEAYDIAVNNLRKEEIEIEKASRKNC